MSDQKNVLDKIRAALKNKMPATVHVHPTAAMDPARPRDFSALLPKTGVNRAEQIALFQENAKDLKADFILAETREQAWSQLQQIARQEQWKKVALHLSELPQQAANALGLPSLTVDGGYAVNDMEVCDAGISECDALVAQTGSVMVTSRSCGGRALSVLPPHHVVLAKISQLVPGLPDAFQLIQKKFGNDYPSMISFITGPSRTGDIERILVLGAHGPKKLTIICLTGE